MLDCLRQLAVLTEGDKVMLTMVALTAVYVALAVLAVWVVPWWRARRQGQTEQRGFEVGSKK